jgi:class 3 adenylate cyclase
MTLLIGPIYAVAPIDVADQRLEGLSLIPRLTYCFGPADLDEIMKPEHESCFQQSSKSALNMWNLFTDPIKRQQYLWLRFSLVNTSDSDKLIYLHDAEFANFSTSLFRDGAYLQHLDDPRRDPERLIPVTVPSGRQHLYLLRVKPIGTTRVELSFLTDKRGYYLASERRALLVGGGFLLAVISFIVNLFVLVLFRSRFQIFYLLYLVSFCFWLGCIWFHFFLPWDHTPAMPIFATMLGLFLLLFAIEFLNLRTYHRLFKAAVVLCLMSSSICLYSMFDGFRGFFILQIYSLIAAPFCFWVGVYVYAKTRRVHNLVYCFAFGALILGTLFAILHSLEVVSWRSAQAGLIYGACLETLIMMLAIGIQILRIEKDRRHSYAQLAKVFYPHQLQQMQDGRMLEETMPVGNHEACILAFDVIGSSQILEPEFASAWEAFMGEARNMMMEGYDASCMRSQAYLIKEVGDGFLCSVGFPFQCRGDHRNLSALQLAEQLRQRFHFHMSRLASHARIHCSIGIAQGHVNGYFSQSGAIRHDLWGHAVVLATRYEQMRYAIFTADSMQAQDIIVLQSLVYLTLPETIQSHFVVLDLKEKGIRVRNDPDAAFLAYNCRGLPALARTDEVA